MGIRQTLNENPIPTTIVASLITVVALVLAIRMSCSGGPGAAAPGGTKQFYSNDDGKTWFADDAKKVPPFDHEGKPAYRVRVFKCGESGAEFVSHMERYTEAEKKRMEEMLAKAAADGKGRVMAMEYGGLQQGLEVKKPGDKEWVKLVGAKDPTKFNRVMQPKCPDGTTNNIQLVLPK